MAVHSVFHWSFPWFCCVRTAVQDQKEKRYVCYYNIVFGVNRGSVPLVSVLLPYAHSEMPGGLL